MKTSSNPDKRPRTYYFFLFSLLLFLIFSTCDFFLIPNSICLTPKKLDVHWGFPFITIKYWKYISADTSGYFVSLAALLANLLLYFTLTIIIYYLLRHIKQRLFRHSP